MNLRATKKFQKSTRKLPLDVLRRLQRVIKLMKSSRDFNELSKRLGPGNVKHLKTKSGTYYSIRLGLYWRLGVEVKGNTVILVKVGSRENFYRDFP